MAPCRPCPAPSPPAAGPMGDAGDLDSNSPQELWAALAKHREAIEGIRLQQASVLQSLSEMEDTWLQSQMVLQGILGRLGEADALQDAAWPRLGDQGPADANAESARTAENGANGGQRRDSRIVPNPEIHRLLARIKKQDSTPQVQTLDPPSAGLWLRLRLRCQLLVRTVWFECFISAVIVANSVMIGQETQMGLHGQALTWAGAAELGFLAIYTVELLIRSIAEQWACLTDWWFIFDFTLVVSACVEQVVYRFTGDEADQIMILRLLRLIRLVRTFRMLRQIRSIWRLVYGLITCGETMFSTFALLGLVIYVFGVLGVEVIAGNEELQSNATTAPILAKYFGSLGMTMMTLSQFVTMDSIAPVYVPLVLEQPLLLLYFLPLGAIVSISLMNLITAVLVEGALEHARQDREEERKLDNITAKQMLPEIVGLFDKMDLDGSGEIGIEEMIQFEKPGGRVMNRRILDRASVDSMEDLFKILDVDGSGRITRAEFEEGLLSIFLREVPISSLQIMRMLRLLRDAVSELQQDVKGFPPQLKGLAAVPSTNRHTWAEMRPAKRIS